MTQLHIRAAPVDILSPNGAANAAERVLRKDGPVALIALGLTCFIAWLMASGVADLKKTLADHVSDSSFYMRQICLNTASTDTQRAGCWPPTQGR